MRGELTVRVVSLKLDGVTVPLHRTATCFGQDHTLRTLAWVMVPVIGLAAIAAHGGEADIAAGTPIVASVTANTRVIPAIPAIPSTPATPAS
jgi:C4-dicarboxylate transporter